MAKRINRTGKPNPNWPSSNDNLSGGGRDNNPPKPKGKR